MENSTFCNYSLSKSFYKNEDSRKETQYISNTYEIFPFARLFGNDKIDCENTVEKTLNQKCWRVRHLNHDNNDEVSFQVFLILC